MSNREKLHRMKDNARSFFCCSIFFFIIFFIIATSTYFSGYSEQLQPNEFRYKKYPDAVVTGYNYYKTNNNAAKSVIFINQKTKISCILRPKYTSLDYVTQHFPINSTKNVYYDSNTKNACYLIGALESYATAGIVFFSFCGALMLLMCCVWCTCACEQEELRREIEIENEANNKAREKLNAQNNFNKSKNSYSRLDSPIAYATPIVPSAPSSIELVPMYDDGQV